eukprot:5689055-Alexandrium_andersonii.AAC.1
MLLPSRRLARNWSHFNATDSAVSTSRLFCSFAPLGAAPAASTRAPALTSDCPPPLGGEPAT